MSSSMKHECAVAGAFNLPGCRELVVTMLVSQQHRGHEWWGISGRTILGGLVTYKYPGLVKDSAGRHEILSLVGDPIIGHDRYSTAGSSTEINAQPHASRRYSLSICANGDIVPFSYDYWHAQMVAAGFPPISQNDAELMLRILEYRLNQGENILEAIRFVQENVVGAFSALVIYGDDLFAFRDKLGIRPLSFAKIGQGFVVASETCALDAVGALESEYVRAGEIYRFKRDGLFDCFNNLSTKHAHCIFELIYFSFPTSYDFGISVCEFRKRLGALFARWIPEDADLIMPVPDSSNFAAIGLSHAAKKPYDHGIVRSHYAGRSFTSPDQVTRSIVAKQKSIPCKEVLRGKSVVVVDDSIVRGTTSKKVIERLFEAGAREVHLRIISPPVKWPCYYGIDTPRQEELIAAQKTTKEICEFVGATTLSYLTVDDLREVVESFGKPADHHCYACFTGEYPTPLS